VLARLTQLGSLIDPLASEGCAADSHGNGMRATFRLPAPGLTCLTLSGVETPVNLAHPSEGTLTQKKDDAMKRIANSLVNIELHLQAMRPSGVQTVRGPTR